MIENTIGPSDSNFRRKGKLWFAILFMAIGTFVFQPNVSQPTLNSRPLTAIGYEMPKAGQSIDVFFHLRNGADKNHAQDKINRYFQKFLENSDRLKYFLFRKKHIPNREYLWLTFTISGTQSESHTPVL